jgi:drug/metabolite transporter (DMT)-like permease
MSKAENETNTQERGRRLSGIYSGLLAAFLLGWAPILGKLAYKANVSPMVLAALRTLVAAIFLWIIYAIFWRKLILLRWKDLLNCLMVGMINGIGSIFYYNGLSRLDASRASLLGTLYPVWVVTFLAASGQPMSKFTLLRLGGSLFGAALVTSPWSSSDAVDYLGAMLMIAYAAITGWYLVMGQWVLADVPARSGTLYIMTGMALTVAFAQFAASGGVAAISIAGWQAIITLGLTTALSRLAMFLSLERLGGVQTAILSLTELAVSLTLAFALLGERMTLMQWIGAFFLLGGGILARIDVEQGNMPSTSFNPMDAQ